MRLTKIERQTYSRQTTQRQPCKQFDSAQIPEQKWSVCFNCGWMQKRHPCTKCKGSGLFDKLNNIDCAACQGTGYSTLV